MSTSTSNTSQNERSVISRDTLVPVGLVITILLAALYINTRLLKIEFKLESIEQKVAEGVDDRWRAADMHHWTELLKARNPELDVPVPEPVVRVSK